MFVSQTGGILERRLDCILPGWAGTQACSSPRPSLVCLSSCMASPLWITAKSGTGKLMGELAFAWRSFTVWTYIVFHYVLNLSLWWESQKLLQVSCVPCPHSFGLLLPWKQMLRLQTDMWNNSLLFSGYKLFPFWVFPCLKTGTCWCRIIGSNPVFMSSLFLQGISAPKPQRLFTKLLMPIKWSASRCQSIPWFPYQNVASDIHRHLIAELGRADLKQWCSF